MSGSNERRDSHGTVYIPPTPAPNPPISGTPILIPDGNGNLINGTLNGDTAIPNSSE